MTGRETEDMAIDCLESHGYEVYQPPHAKYREQDVFGLFDLLAFGHGRLYCVQVKGGRDASGIEEWFDQARPFEEHIDGLEAGFWHRKEGVWRIAESAADGYEWVYDGRRIASTENPPLREVVR